MFKFIIKVVIGAQDIGLVTVTFNEVHHTFTDQFVGHPKSNVL